MLTHITFGTTDLDRASRFYDALLGPIGLRQRQVEPDGGPPMRCWVTAPTALPRFFVCEPFNSEPATAGNGTMIAFDAPSREAVDAGYRGGMAEGGTDEGLPGPRDHYAKGYYGAYLRDPDGNKVHLVYRGHAK